MPGQAEPSHIRHSVNTSVRSQKTSLDIYPSERLEGHSESRVRYKSHLACRNGDAATDRLGQHNLVSWQCTALSLDVVFRANAGDCQADDRLRGHNRMPPDDLTRSRIARSCDALQNRTTD